MSTTADHPQSYRSSKRPWVVPAVVTTVVVATAVSVPLIADADSELPERSAAELIGGLAESRDVPFAGTIVHSADLGLPDLPAHAGDESSPWDLLSGASTARIWYTDLSTFRIALQGELSEIDLIRDGENFWYWDSEQNTVTRDTLQEGAGLPDELEHKPEAMLAPEAMAQMALNLVEPSTDVSVDGTATVAGRAAYELVIRPKDERSLVGSVRVAIDGEHGIPLRVQIYSAAGGDPAVELGFTSISFSEPDPSVYEFTPPPGAETREFEPGTWLGQGHHGGDQNNEGDRGDRPDGLEETDVEVTGDAWASILVISGLRADDLAGRLEELAGGADEHVGDMSAMIDTFLAEMEQVQGEYGSGMALQSDLFSVLWLDDGRLLVGAVELDVLEEAAR